MSTMEVNYARFANEWLKISDQLKTYEGLSAYCQDVDFQRRTINILGTIHRYDSVLLAQIDDASLNLRPKASKKILNQIEVFRRRYSVHDFNVMFARNCSDRRTLERTKSRTYSASGIHSFDAQVLNLEMMLTRYLNRIDKRLISLEEHLHLIQPHSFEDYQVVISPQQD